MKEEYDFDVLEINKKFDKFPFDTKIQTIQNEIKEKTKVIANSFGAYLLLNSLIEKLDFELLLITPVLGIAMSNGGGRIPPNFSSFRDNIKRKKLFIPDKTRLISGNEDEICPVGNIRFIEEYYPQIQVEVLVGGHQLSKNHIKKVIEKFND